MDELLHRAYQRRERLRQELLAIENFIAQYEKLSVTPSSTPINLEFNLESPTQAAKRRRGPDVTSLMDAAEAAIVQAGKPLSRSELVRAMEGRGFGIVGGDKSKVFGTNLWRSGRFFNLKGFGYWPKSQPVPREYADAEARPSQIRGGKADTDYSSGV